MAEAPAPSIVLLPDAGPLITLAYADALDLLLKPGWRVQIVDMVSYEVTRKTTPTSEKIRHWAAESSIPVLNTQTFQRYLAAQAEAGAKPRKANPGEIAIQETMTSLALSVPETRGVFLFEDHKIRSRQFSVAGQLPQGQHSRLAAVSGGKRMDCIHRRHRAGGDRQRPQLFPVEVSARMNLNSSIDRVPNALVKRDGQNAMWVRAVVGYSAAVLFVWLFFATYARYWLPYQFYPWVLLSG